MVNYLYLFVAIWPAEKTKRLAQYVCIAIYLYMCTYIYM